jgi:hypothetical protein
MTIHDIKSNFPPHLIRPFYLKGSHINHLFKDEENTVVDDETMEAIESCWDMWMLADPKPVKEINFKWHIDYFKNCFRIPLRYITNCEYPLKNRVLFTFAFIKYKVIETYYLLRMSKAEKGLYINGHGWTPSKFFQMKKEAKKLQKDGRIVVRGRM